MSSELNSLLVVINLRALMSSELNSLLVVINLRAYNVELNSLLVVILRAYNVVRIKLIACRSIFIACTNKFEGI